MKTQIPLLQMTRGVVGSLAMFLGFMRIVALPLADAQAISFSRNLFLVPLAFILAEAVGPRRAIAARGRFCRRAQCCAPAWKRAWRRRAGKRRG